MPRLKRPIKELSDARAKYYEDQEAQGGLYDLFGLSNFEKRWTSYHDYLLERGYQLRPRYRPSWARSWKGTNQYPEDCEDAWTRMSKLTLDALRLSDGQQVMIKKIIPPHKDPEANLSQELKIAQYLSSPELIADPRNHAMEYLESFPIPDVPGGVFMITKLYAAWDRPQFETIDEVIDCIRQVLEGLAFLHEHRIAHRDCIPPNIMMDPRPLQDELFHPIRNDCSLDGEYYIEQRSRSQAPVRYFYIDFDISTWFETAESQPKVLGKLGRIQPPELSDTVPYDPFKADVFIIGVFLEEEFVKKYHGFGFLRPMIRKMIRELPEKRPTVAQVEKSFLRRSANISPRTRRWALTPRDSGMVTGVTLKFQSLWNQFMFTLQRMLAMITSTLFRKPNRIVQ